MPKFLTFHHEPGKSWEKLEEAYARLAQETMAVWIRTYYDPKEGHRICEWDAPSDESLVVIFKRMGISLERIVSVEEVLPSRWR